MTILVADDDTRVRAQVVGALRDQGYRVIDAVDGLAALEMLRGEPAVRLLVSDVRMPGLSGPELATIALAERPALSIVFMSGDTGGLPASAFLGRPLLAKPFTIATLLAAVTTAYP